MRHRPCPNKVFPVGIYPSAAAERGDGKGMGLSNFSQTNEFGWGGEVWKQQRQRQLLINEARGQIFEEWNTEREV